MAEDAHGRARLLEAAMAAARRGWPVLPLRPYSKRPAIRDWPSRASTAAAQLAQWWSAAPWNIEVVSVHAFSTGLGLAAPQISIDRAVAVVRMPECEPLTLLNPHITEESVEADEQYEGCLSFFDVRGIVARPLAIYVEHEDTLGRRDVTCFERRLARLVAHAIDHLDGRLYTDRMRPGVKPVPISQYHGGGST